jgi:hypothetical protein
MQAFAVRDDSICHYARKLLANPESIGKLARAPTNASAWAQFPFIARDQVL